VRGQVKPLMFDVLSEVRACLWMKAFPCSENIVVKGVLNKAAIESSEHTGTEKSSCNDGCRPRRI